MPVLGTWYQHPVTVFLVPLIALLCLPQLYRFLPFNTDPSYDESKLQEIASLMDDIYALLANQTFIPHNAITRGPHKINTTALSCKPNRSVLKLIEILPYVDISLVQEPDWIYGGWFMDYRNPEHLAELCDPLRGESINWTDYMKSADIALTNWGTGGWNNDYTWVLIYNTERESIRIFDAQLWLHGETFKRNFGKRMSNWWFEDDGAFEWDRQDGAPHILRAIADSFRHIDQSPWGTSNRESPGFGVPYDEIETLLRRNGWPNAFNASQFNADFIRKKHRPSGKGHAVEVAKRIDRLAGFDRYDRDGEATWIESVKGSIAEAEELSVRERKAYEMESNSEERDMKRYRHLRATWLADYYREELEAARLEFAQLCPNGVCVEEADLILWEYLALQRTREEIQFYKNFTDCEYRIQREVSNGRLLNHRLYAEHGMADTPKKAADQAWLDKCLTNEAIEQSWHDLAIEQSHQAALAHCKELGCKLIPFKDILDRAHDKIAEHKRKLERAVRQREQFEANFPARMLDAGDKAREQMERDKVGMCGHETYIEEEIKSIQEHIAKLKRGDTSGERPDRVHKGLLDYLKEEDD